MAGVAGTVNKGGGGGGVGSDGNDGIINGSTGGSGVVIIKYYSPIVAISVYKNGSSGSFCTGTGGNANTNVNIYNSTYTTLANMYTNNSSIYSDSGLTTLAPTGYYGMTNGGGGTTWYSWTNGGSSSGWTSTGDCAD